MKFVIVQLLFHVLLFQSGYTQTPTDGAAQDSSGNENSGASTYCVSPSGSDSNPGTDKLPMKTIQHALNSGSLNASDEIIIKVSKGTYYENISIVCCSSVNNWRILGGWNSDFSEREENPSKTVIDGSGKRRVIKINVPALNLTIDGLTIRNGFDSVNGGGIAVFPFYHGTITLNLVNNIIARNRSGSAGGGVYVSSRKHATTTLTLINNVIANNSADDSCGGICVNSEDSANTVVTLTGNTVIDNHAGYHGGGIYMRSYSGATITATFTNNTITHNSASYYGAGIYLYSESDAALTTDFNYNTISDNKEPYFGGGVYLHSVSAATLTTSFTNNKITGNSAGIHGGGIYTLSASVADITSSFTHNTITGNSAEYDGGGVFSLGNITSTFSNNIIADNSASRGAGVFATEGTALTFKNDTITGNTGFLGDGLFLHSAGDVNTSVDIINTIIWGNDSSDIYNLGGGTVNAAYSDIGRGTFNNNQTNTNADPQFINSINKNYHLSSSSPLINKGDNSDVSWSTDIDGDTRIIYGRVDIGADEYVLNFIKSDILPTVDGDLSEYEGADKITLLSVTGGNTAIIRAIWNNEALYLSYDITDANLNASVTIRDGGVLSEDSVGWAIDTLNNDGGSADPNSAYMLPDDYFGIINILNTQYDGRGTSTGSPSDAWNGNWQSAVRIKGTNNNNTDVDTGYAVEIKIPWSTLGFAGTPGDTQVRVGLFVNDKDESACDIDPDGTYIDAENFTGTISQGTGTFSVASSQAGYLGSGYLRSNGGGSGVCPPVHQGKQYQVNFPSPGTYKVWIKGYSIDDSSDSLFIGLDGTCVGALTEDVSGQWSWTKSVNNGTNTINVTTPGVHTINIWIRESSHLVDGIYVTQGTEIPSDALHGIEINPVTCGAAQSAMWPQGGGTEFKNASNWQNLSLSALTTYYCDNDHDGYIESFSNSVCPGIGCEPLYCRTVPGTDCDDYDFYEHPDQTWYKDSDNDNYSDGTTDQISCSRPSGYKTDLELTAASGDCDDTNEFAYPWAPEIWYDGVDQDCDGWNDYDQDMDTFVHEDWNAKAWGTSPGINDCDDANSVINTDTKWCPDIDGDGYGYPTICFVQCNQPAGYVLDNLDCDDNDANIYPGGPTVRISGGIPAYYSSLQEAYDAASSGETLQCQDTVYSETLFFDLDKSVNIEGGYDCSYSVTTGITTVSGDMILIDGAITAEHFEVIWTWD